MSRHVLWGHDDLAAAHARHDWIILTNGEKQVVYHVNRFVTLPWWFVNGALMDLQVEASSTHPDSEEE